MRYVFLLTCTVLCISFSAPTITYALDGDTDGDGFCGLFEPDCNKKLYGSDDRTEKASTDDDVKTTTHQKAIEPDDPWGKKKNRSIGDIIGKQLETR